MKSGYLIIAARLEIFAKLLLGNGISFHPKYLLRTAWILQAGVWSSFLALREKIICSKKIRNHPLPRDPIFIIGHWRSGSTFLQQLLSCDPNLTTPTYLQCCYPDSFLSSHRFIAPILKKVLTKTRPMDNVSVGIDEPQEDENALFRLCGISPLEKLIFPKIKNYFLLPYKDFIPEEPLREKWEQAFATFAKKLHLQTNKRILFKNPFHSMRIPLLITMFPDALFIHIYRDPCYVIPSTMRMWDIVGTQNNLRKQWQPPELEEVITVFDRMMARIYGDLALLPTHTYTEIRFEDLETNPIQTLRMAYKSLRLSFTDEFERNVKKFIVKEYEKNSYALKNEDKKYICVRLKRYLELGKYNPDTP